MPRDIKPIHERLWAKVQFPLEHLLNTSCWLWTGATSKKRSGHRPVIREAGKGSRILIAARVVCEWYHGPPPTPEHVAGHTCPDGENRMCVSPHHLQWMTKSENEQAKPDHLRGGRARCITAVDAVYATSSETLA